MCTMKYNGISSGLRQAQQCLLKGGVSRHTGNKDPVKLEIRRIYLVIRVCQSSNKGVSIG